MKSTETQMKKLLEILKEYPMRSSLDKLKVQETNYVDFAELYVFTIKPFLKYVELKDNSLMDLFDSTISGEDQKKLSDLLNDLKISEIEFGKSDLKEEISEIISKKHKELCEIKTIILVLLSELKKEDGNNATDY